MCWIALLGERGVMAQDEGDAFQRIATLREQIAYHDDLYFRQAAPEITDYEYDLLKVELRRLQREAGISADGPEQSLGDDRRVGANQVAHASAMLSLEKAYSPEEVDVFLQRVVAANRGNPVRFVVEPKFDGVAVSLTLRRGGLLSAATRGNGLRGEDVLAQVGAIHPLHYDANRDEQDTDNTPTIESIELRGEVYLPFTEFERLNREREAAGETAFRHPRSVAAGSIKLDDLTEVAARRLAVVIHGWGHVEPERAAPPSVSAFQHWLEERGLPGVANSRSVVTDEVRELESVVSRVRDAAIVFPADGVVIKVDDVALQGALGNGPTAPRWAIARKFVPPRETTVLREIVWQVGRTGVLTPVAIFDEIELSGSRVARASLHNAAELQRRDLRIGDTIWVEKAGEIIPAIAGVDPGRRPADSVPVIIPTACPACDQKLNTAGNAAGLICRNRACPEQLIQRLLHYAARNAMRVRGLGPGLARKLVEAGLVRTIPDLYVLESEQLIALPGVGLITSERLLSSIEESRHRELWRVLVGAGLPGLGPRRARDLASNMQGLGDLFEADRRTEILAELGAVVGARLEEALREPGTMDLLRALEAQGLGAK